MAKSGLLFGRTTTKSDAKFGGADEAIGPGPELALIERSPILLEARLSVKRTPSSKRFPGTTLFSESLWVELRGDVLLGYRSEKRRRDEVVFVEQVLHASVSLAAKDKTKLTIQLTPPAPFIELRFNKPDVADLWKNMLECVSNQPVARLSDFEMVAPLGKGGAGRVFLVRRKKTGAYEAMKVIAKYDVLETSSSMRLALDERQVLERTAGHPFVMQLFDAFQTEQNLYLVLEFCPGGNLDNYLRRQQSFRISEQHAKLMLAEVLLALRFLHDNGIMYRDLKPENLLIAFDGHISVGDFGLAKLASSETGSGVEQKTRMLRTRSFCGTQEYVSPQVVHGDYYGTGVDLWAFGIFMFRCLVGFTPFYEKLQTRSELFRKIEFDEPRFPPSLSSEAQGLLSWLLSKSESDRPKVEEVQKHAWFDEIDWDLVAKKEYQWFDGRAPLGLDPMSLRNFRTDNLRGMVLEDIDELSPEDHRGKFLSSSKTLSRLKQGTSVRKNSSKLSLIAGYSFSSSGSFTPLVSSELSNESDP
eukprot:CAMPEP_0185847678 /NCGR_PEP_ID=MMETSP1354-20130828/2859_1 /TAXON_ID=708628 /ORGANISM="Erythrolobus madagascarensis, Strain CCMP3276" /LENGTH=528 /DNA_ID=CAMNT_0028547999 /DNA_START=104 /DNA_END=1690 /DNA_ORIENTATION=+